MPKSVVLELQTLIWAELADTQLVNLSDEKLEQIATRLHAFEVKPSGTEGYRTAEVTLGGVDTTEVSSKTMESKKQKAFTLSVKCWMYPSFRWLQFSMAWASAHAASQYV